MEKIKPTDLDNEGLAACPCCESGMVERQPCHAYAADEMTEIEMGVVICVECGISVYCEGQDQADKRWNVRPSQVNAFKEYVHERLDSMSVPSDPDTELTEKTGCRIRSRLNYVEQRLAYAEWSQ